MKQLFYILLFGIVGSALLLILRTRPPVNGSLLSQSAHTNIVASTAVSSPTGIITQVTSKNVTSASKELLDAMKPHSIADWTNAFPALKPQIHSKYYEVWDMTLMNEPNLPKVVLSGTSGVTVQYSFYSVDIGVESDSIQRIEMQTPAMNIDNTKELGLQLCKMLGLDSKTFEAWCNHVGNHWLDASLYSSKDVNHIGFQTLRAYNDEKPWIIDFVIASP